VTENVGFERFVEQATTVDERYIRRWRANDEWNGGVIVGGVSV
jgi:hypothetical protein